MPDEGSETRDFCPYVGLAPFGETHADYYFGRDLDAATLADNVLIAPITVLYGASGVGKTSLLNVGLPKAFRRLDREATLVIFRSWQDRDFLTQLQRQIAETTQPAASAAVELAPSLVEQVRKAVAATDKPLILVLDQFEEYFIYHRDARATAFEALLDALAREGDDVHVLIASREDRYHLLDRLRASVPCILDNTLEITHLDDSSIAEAVEEPIRVYNAKRGSGEEAVIVEPGFTERLTSELKQVRSGLGIGRSDESESRAIELPYLQLALEKLWDAAGKGKRERRLDGTLLDDHSVEQIVQSHLDKVMRGLGREDQEICARLFDRMVTPSGAKIAMGAADLAQFAGAGVDRQRVERILERLSRREARIVSPVARPDEEPAFEIFHDVLGLPIIDWKEGFEAERRHEQEKLQAEERLKFERHRSRTASRVAILMSVIMLSAAGAGIYAYRQYLNAEDALDVAHAANIAALEAWELAQRQAKMADQAAQIAKQEEENSLRNATAALAALSRVEMERGSPETAAKLALAAWPRRGAQDVPIIRNAELALISAAFRLGLGHERLPLPANSREFDLASARDFAAVIVIGYPMLWNFRTSEATRLPLSDAEIEDEPSSIAVSWDSAQVAVGWRSGSVSIWQVDGLQKVLRRDLHGGEVSALAFSPDGRLLLSGSDDWIPKAIEIPSGELRYSYDKFQSSGESAAFSPDGQLFAIGAFDGRISIYKTEDGSLLRSFNKYFSSVDSLQFSQDSKRILSASNEGRASIIDVETGETQVSFTGHKDGFLFDAKFSDSERFVATASDDKTARIWDARSGEELFVLVHKSWVLGAAFIGPGIDVFTTSFENSGTWSIDVLRRGSFFRELCNLVGDHGVEDLSDDFGIDVAAPICTGDEPLPDWSRYTK